MGVFQALEVLIWAKEINAQNRKEKSLQESLRSFRLLFLSQPFHSPVILKTNRCPWQCCLYRGFLHIEVSIKVELSIRPVWGLPPKLPETHVKAPGFCLVLIFFSKWSICPQHWAVYRFLLLFTSKFCSYQPFSVARTVALRSYRNHMSWDCACTTETGGFALSKTRTVFWQKKVSFYYSA